MNKLLAAIIRTIITIYRHFISPWVAPRCRFYPTCSTYGLEAVRLHGGFRGGWLTLKRLARCHPWGGYGIDFVPKPLYCYTYHYVRSIPAYYLVYAYHYY